MRRYFTLLGVLALASLAGCGFHLRRSAALPASMQSMVLTVSGGGDLQRELTRAVELNGSQVVDAPGPGVAQLNVPVVSFRSDALSMNRFSRISEYAVRLHLEFEALDASGKVIAPRQSIDLSRDFTYDATQTIGSSTQTEQLQAQMRSDAVQAILLRLQAIARHPSTAEQAQSKAVPTGDASDGD